MSAATINDLARAVDHSDRKPRVSLDTIEAILDIALRSTVGLSAMRGRVTAINLGNGFELHCTAVDIQRAAEVTRGSGFDLVEHLYRQRSFSLGAFGPGARTEGVLDHIRKELFEVAAAPSDVTEWVDLVLLALDGAWRAGHDPETIAQAIRDKQLKNEKRRWPDWRNADPTKAIEHVRGVSDEVL